MKRSMREYLTLPFFLLAAACSQSIDTETSTTEEAADFSYIEIDKDSILTTHRLPYRISRQNISPVAALHRTDIFDGVPYKISLSGFLADSSAIVIHAERVADDSGASNYEHLDISNWPTNDFRSSGAACINVPEEEVREEHDLNWMAENGFKPSGEIALQQYFATTEDHNDELVISLIARVEDCSDDFDSALEVLRESVAIERLN